MKIFGIGLNKTGTKTLGECFRVLGFKNKSFDPGLMQSYAKGDYQAILEACDPFDSFEDWPYPLVYREFDLHYSEAKFILTLRKDPETWFLSLCRHAEMTGPTEARKIAYGYEMPMDHREHHIAAYQRHEREVLEYFRNRPGKLLVVSWEKGDGWKEICGFLGIPEIPRIPFPHKNRSAKNA